MNLLIKLFPIHSLTEGFIWWHEHLMGNSRLNVALIEDFGFTDRTCAHIEIFRELNLLKFILFAFLRVSII